MKRWLAAALLAASRGAAAEAPAWFPPSPCPAATPAELAPPGGMAFVHAHVHADEGDLPMKRAPDGSWWLPREAWQRWTRRLPEASLEDASGRHWVLLRTGSELAFRIDACTAELWLDPDLHSAARIDLEAQGLPPTPAGTGGYVNLDAHYGGFLGSGKASALVELGGFDALGSLRSGLLASGSRLRRLDTAAIHDEVATAMRLRLGDSLSRPFDWEPAVRYAGLQWGSDFSLQPTRITYPLPTVRGTAALPSTVELYANGSRIGQTQVDGGNYQLVGVPTLSGAGELSVRVRDPLGREQSYTQSFYASPRLLAEGLQTQSWEAGFLREGYASADDRYTQGFVALSLRRGLDAALTASLRSELRGRGGMAGAGLDWRLATLGVVSAGLAASLDADRGGALLSLGFEHIGPHFALSLRRVMASSAYQDLGRAARSLQFSDSARLSFSAGRDGSISLVYAGERAWAQAPVQFIGAALSQRLAAGVNLSASALHPLAGHQGDSLQVGLTVLLGPRTSANLQAADEQGRAVRRYAAQYAPSGPTGLAAQASYDDSATGIRMLDAQWSAARGSVGVGLEGVGERLQPAAALRTGVAFIDGASYWTRPVDASFAVVDAGAPQVRVYRDHLEVGRTGDDGRLLVSDLRAYEANELAIDDRDLPIDRSLLGASQTIAPPAGAGVRLRFAVDAAAPSRLLLRQADGRAVPAGAALSLDGQPQPLPVGLDGLVYLSLPAGAQALSARWAGGGCTAELRSSGAELRAEVCREDGP